MATKYWMSGGVDSNWSSDTNWSTTSSAGPNNTTHAVAGDAVILDSGSPNCTVNTASACDSLDCTGYTATLAMGTQNLTLGGSPANVTLAAGMTITGTTGYLACIASGTLTANGKTWPARLSFAGTAQTYTLADAWSVTGRCDTGGATSVTINGSTLTIAGGTSFNNAVTTGTTALTLTGGTWGTQGWTELDLTIAGNVTLGTTSNQPLIRSSASRSTTLIYSSGTLTQGTSTLTIGGGSVGTPTILNTSGVTWTSVTLQTSGGATNYISLSSTFNATTLRFKADHPLTFVGAAGFSAGTLTNSGTLTTGTAISLLQTNTYTVTTAFTLAGTASFRWTLASSSGTLKVPFVMSGASPTLAYVNATRVDSSGGSTIHTSGTIVDSLNWDNAVAGGVMWLS